MRLKSYVKVAVKLAAVCTCAVVKLGTGSSHYSLEDAGSKRGWEGMGGCGPPPFGTEQVRTTKVYHPLSACSYFDTVHMHLGMNRCFMFCKHKALKSAAPDSSVAVPKNTKADFEGTSL